jgi:predicted nucleotidyltransferase
MDILDDELLKFWRGLNDNHVKYIMVGGFASRFHGFNRNTDDLDIWLEDTLQNRKNLRKSFTELGYGDFPSLETMEFVAGWTSFYVGNIIALDIMTKMKGLEDYTFNECMAMASIADLDGVLVPFLHINQLIANKKAVNRPKDQIDVLELERIKRIREENT